MCSNSSWWMRSSSLSPGGLASSLARRAPTRSSSSRASGVPGSGGPCRLFHSPASHSHQLVGAAVAILALAVSRVSRRLGTAGCSTDSANAEGDSSTPTRGCAKGASPTAVAALPAAARFSCSVAPLQLVHAPNSPKQTRTYLATEPLRFAPGEPLAHPAVAAGALCSGWLTANPLFSPSLPHTVLPFQAPLLPATLLSLSLWDGNVWECMQATCRGSQGRAFEEGHRERQGGDDGVSCSQSGCTGCARWKGLPRRQKGKGGLYAVQCVPAGMPGRPHEVHSG